MVVYGKIYFLFSYARINIYFINMEPFGFFAEVLLLFLLDIFYFNYVL